MRETDDFEKWLRLRGMSPSTIQQRKKFARLRYAEWHTWDPTPSQVAEWLDRYTGWTRRTYYSHAVSMFLWLQETGIIDASPLTGLRAGRQPKAHPNPLTPQETQLALSHSTGRTRAILLLGLYAGLRSHEIAKIHGSDVTESAIYVVGKGGQGATVPTHPVLWELARQHPRDGYWFPSPYRHREHISSSLVGQVIASHFRQLGIGGSIHRTRATYGTTLLREGVNLRVIQELLRHSSLTSTVHYLGVSEDERRAAILRLAA